jgi:hypothetical protein
MKRIKANEKQKKAPMKESTKILIYALIGIAFLITAVLVIIENTPNRIVVKIIPAKIWNTYGHIL